MVIRSPGSTRRDRSWRLVAIAVVLLTLSTGAAALAQTEPDATISMARPTWDTGWFQAEIYRQLLDDLGYEVSGPRTMDNEEFYRAAAAGDVDFWASGWFPLHQQYLGEDRIADAIEVVGTQVEAGALQGYLIDQATAERHGVTNLEALRDPDIAELFDVDGNGRADLIGCNVEWACADVIDHHLEAYGLGDTVEQIQGDYSLLMRETVDRHTAGEPILFYTFTPNWTVGELVPGRDVRWLETPFPSRPRGQRLAPGSTEIAGLAGCPADPCQTGWPANDIQVVANRGFLDANPPAARLLEAIEIPLNDILDQNARMAAGEGDFADIERQARAWISGHPGLVDGWLSAADPASVPESGDGARALTRDRELDTLRVAARSFPPFVIYENRVFGGFEVELVDLIAEELGVDYELYGVNSIAKQLDDVDRGAADVAIAGLGVTADREERVDFTHSIFETGLQVMVPAAETGGPVTQLRRIGGLLLRSNALWMVVLFFATLALSAHLVWWFERRDNPDFHSNYRQGIWDSFWWSAVTVTTVGYGDKAPKGHLGRGWALLWMIAGYFVFASFTASLTSTLAVEELRGAINGPDDLVGHKVATVAGTAAEDYLSRQGVGPVTVGRVEDAYAQLDSGDADAIAFDAPVLQFHASHEGNGEVRVVGPVFEQVRYGLAVPIDSPLRERINGALLELIESGAYDQLRDRWFGSTAAVGG